MAKKNIKVRDLKPNKDAKGGGGLHHQDGTHPTHGAAGTGPTHGQSGTGPTHAQSGHGGPKGGI